MRKAQGLPLQVIVAGALMIIVVAILIIAFGGGFSSSLKRLNIFAGEQASNDTELMETQCRQACFSLRNEQFKDARQLLNTEYCTLRWGTSAIGGIKGDSCVDDEEGGVVSVSCGGVTLSSGETCSCISCGRSKDCDECP